MIIKTNEQEVNRILQKIKDNKEVITDTDVVRYITNKSLPENGYFMNISNTDCNAELIMDFEYNIKKHPLLWKWFFMI